MKKKDSFIIYNNFRYHEENSESILESLHVFKPSIDIDLKKFKVKEKFSH
jgi:hypothetical protein